MNCKEGEIGLSLMGFNNCIIIITFMLYISQSRFAQGTNQRYNTDFLNVFLRNYTYTNVVRPRTGILYLVSPPSNFSGIEVSFARFRTKSFYFNGVNFSSFDIPPNTEPSPFVRRFDVIYEHLGNWSSYYFNVPNYSLVSPVIGLSVYNATNPAATKKMNLSLHANANPILVHFPHISLPEGIRNATTECVRFGTEGSVELTNMSSPNVCMVQQEGHFAVVVRSFPSHRKHERFWKRWVIGFGVGIVGFVTLALLGVFFYKFIKRGRIVQMEKETERSEVLGTTWIGNSKMPSAQGIRTQPVLMNEDGP